MTGRTHDLAGMTTLTAYLAYEPLLKMTLATGVVAAAACAIGAITPDIDEPTAPLWNNLPAGSIVGRIVHPLLGGHRMISHSLLGLALFSWGLKLLLGYTGKFLLVDNGLVWWTFVMGYGSHLVMDTITRDGVPWLFPIPVKFGFPPIKAFRFTTGAWGEKILVFPGLAFLNGYLIYSHYGKFLEFFKHYLLK